MDKRMGKVQWGPQGARKRTSAAYWRQPLLWDRAAKQAGERQRVFCASLADWLEDRSELVQWRAELLALVSQTRWLDWLLLSKRIEDFEKRMIAVTEVKEPDGSFCHGAIVARNWLDGLHPMNVWLGTSVENQATAAERTPHLLRVPAAVRFLSCEPLLGPLDIRQSLSFNKIDELHPDDSGGRFLATLRGMDWIIVGGESGPNKRRFDCGWARSIRDQCQAAGVPFFFKQVDKVQPIPDDLMIREFPRTTETAVTAGTKKQFRAI